MLDLDLTPLEIEILRRSTDLQTTRRRRAIIVISGTMFTSLLLYIGIQQKSNLVLILITVVYVIITMIEKLIHAYAVILYKGLIQKLVTKIEEKERVEHRK